MAAELDVDAYVRRIVASHFDLEHGAPYWLGRQRELGIDARSAVRSADDLHRLGPMDDAALRDRPVLDFVPLSQRAELAGAVVTETGGTTGRPKRTVFSRAEFTAAFVTPFVRVAERVGFPRGASWLWIGPSGPHVIGQAAAACAAELGSPQPFAIDFDPRWFRKLPSESAGRERYLRHLVDQALDVIRVEPIEVVFTTPVMLERLAVEMTAPQRERVRGVHYGGMRVAPETLLAAETEWFPNAVHIAGYGNSLFGVCMEAGGPPTRTLRYFPHGPRHLVRVALDGRVWMSRLDPTVLIANLAERDQATPALPPEDLWAAGFHDGVEDPRPIAATTDLGNAGIY